MKGKVCVVTGATSGIGQAAATAFVAMGAQISLVARSAEKAEATRRRIQQATGSAQIEVFLGDLGVQADVRRIADRLLERHSRIDVLFNNAGVTHLGYQETSDGIETTFAVNHLAYFLLTQLLLPRLRETPGARIVNTASDAYKVGGALDFEDLGCKRSFGPRVSYGRSKLANLLFTRELARREGPGGVHVNAYHPGFVRTGLGANNGWLGRVITKAIAPLARSPERGARTAVWLASAAETAPFTGGYFANEKPHPPGPRALDDVAARRLWQVSLELTGQPPEDA